MRKIPGLLVAGILAINAYAQDAQYSQFYANPLYLNPAFAGTAHNTRITLNNRVQFPNLPEAYNTFSASADYSAVEYNSGFGFIFHKESQGTADLNLTSGAFIYSYHLVIHKTLVIQPAMKFGHVIRGFDQTQLLLGDQLDFGGGITSQDPQLRSLRLKNYWDIGSGFLIYTDKAWFGVGIDHMNRPNTSLLEGNDKLPIKYSFHFGSRFRLSKHIPTGMVPATVAPSILYKKQGNFQQLDIGASVHMQPLVLGAYYRGIPFMLDNFGGISQDAFIFQVGLEYTGFELGYSFDIQLSQFDIVTGGGAHELALHYNFHLPWKNRKKPKRKLHCPAFLHGLHH